MLLHAAINDTKDIVSSRLGKPGGVLGVRASAAAWLTLWLM